MTEHNARPLTSAVRFCVRGVGDLDDASLARAVAVAEARGWRMDELVVGSEALRARAAEALALSVEDPARPSSPGAVAVDGSIGERGWYVRGGRR